jgi:hypothetical protein
MKSSDWLYKYRFIIGGGIALAIVGVAIYLNRKKKTILDKTKPTKGIIIGDSQTPLIAKRTTKASLLGAKGGEENLWLGGMGLKWLKGAVDKYPVTQDVGNVVINIGTNGGFSKGDDIKGLLSSLKTKFPNASLFVVQGSWGWGGNKDVTQAKVDAYYNNFKPEATVLNPPIGVVKDPHGNLPIYKEIGKSIDNAIG